MADHNLNTFYQKLSNKGAFLTHQYQVSFGGIKATGVETAFKDAGLTIFAKSNQVPGRTQNFAEVKYLGIPFDVKTNFEMDTTLELEIVADLNHKLHNAFMMWKAYHSDLDVSGGSTGGGNKAIPSSFMILDLYDGKMTNIVSQYKLHGVIPTEVGNITVTNAAEANSIATFRVSFKYQFWSTPIFTP